MPLSDFGRKQAFKLSECLADIDYDQVHCSDLIRSVDTTFYALAFPGGDDINQTRQLRELNFGEHEGLHFDNLPSADKARFADPEFRASGGESWPEVRLRAQTFFSGLNRGTHLCFTHGGLITTYLHQHGVEEMPPNGSVLGVTLAEDGSAESLEFNWEFPYIEEDI